MTKYNNIKDTIDIIKYPIITDKTTKIIEDNIYCFAVERKANKIQIKNAIENIFNVKVQKVNTIQLPRQKKNMGKFRGYKTRNKKALIKLNEGYTINLFNTNLSTIE